MENPAKEYLLLFNVFVDAQNTLESLRTKLIESLNEAEDMYISQKN